MLRMGKWNGRQVVPENWVRTITRAITPIEKMNPESYKEGDFGYGVMWWIWDGQNAVGPYKGGYSARGAYGQYIAVLPALDMAIAHKTAVPPRERRVNWGRFEGIIKRLIEARIEN